MPESLIEIVAEVEARFAAARLEQQRGADALARLLDYADVLKQLHPDWLTAGHADALFLRRVEALRPELGPPSTSGRLVGAEEAAAYLGLVKSGTTTPRDSYYAIARDIGTKIAGKWMIREDRLHAYARGEEAA
jgi:hypothetical protein